MLSSSFIVYTFELFSHPNFLNCALNGSAATNTGDGSAAEVSGKHAVACALGIASKARAAACGAIVLCHRNDYDGSLIHIRASKVGENGIEADVWYTLNSAGEFVKA